MRKLTVPGLPFDLRSVGGATGLEPKTESGVVVLRAEAGADLFIDPSGQGSTPDAERYLAEVVGDFQFSCKVAVEFANTFDSAVLIGWIDETHWFKLCAELDPQGAPRVVSVVTRVFSDDCNSWLISGDQVWLRLSRVGSAVALHASADGAQWHMVRYFSMELTPEQPLQVGILAQSPAGPGVTAYFSHFRFVPAGLDNVRDGS
jgi:hypothetical protein